MIVSPKVTVKCSKQQEKTVYVATIHAAVPHFKINCVNFMTFYRDRAAFLRLGGLKRKPKAFLACSAGASVLGGLGGMLPRNIFKINASRMAKNTSQCSRHSEFFYYLSG